MLISPRQVLAAMKGAFGRLKLHLGRRSRRSQRGAGRRVSVQQRGSRGRPVRLAGLRGDGAPLAVLPSVLAAILRRGTARPIRLRRDDLRVWIRQGQAPLHMMLIVDASASTFHFLEPMAKMLSVLYRDAYRNRDRLGLVAIQDGLPRVMHPPSRNLRRVLGNLTRLKPSGHTPLADALRLALTTFRQAGRRTPEMNPLAVLLSDCHPEPVEAPDGDLMAAPPYLEAQHAARLFRQARIPVVVINPAHGAFKDGRRWWGTALAMRIAALSAGRYYGIPHDRYEKDAGMVQRFFERGALQADTQAITHLLREFRYRSAEEPGRPGRGV